MIERPLTLIVVRLQYLGLHCWPGVNVEAVKYLASPHRHTFYITCKKTVKHSDREIEVITFKENILSYLNRHFNHNFQSMSCEHIAEHLLQTFDLNYCEVLEDNENGAEAHKIN